MPIHGRRARQSGFVLIAMSVAMLLMMGMVGMAFDFGRVYIARNEAQLFTDGASMTAAARLNSGASLEEISTAITNLPMRWNLGNEPFTGVTIQYSADRKSWTATPEDLASIEFVRVMAPSNQVQITFLRAVGAPNWLTVPAYSIARVHPVRLAE